MVDRVRHRLVVVKGLEKKHTTVCVQGVSNPDRESDADREIDRVADDCGIHDEFFRFVSFSFRKE
jgi:hypothetical protein